MGIAYQEALVSDKRKGMFFRDRIRTNFLIEMARCVGHPEHVWAWALLQAHFVLFRYLIKNPNPSLSARGFQEAHWSFLPFDDGKSYRRAEILLQLPSFALCWGQALSSVALDTGLHEPERSRVSLTLLDKMSKINEEHSRFSLGLALRRTLPPTDGFKLLLLINKAFYSGVGVINNDLTYYKTKLNFSSPGKDLEAPLLIIAAQQGDNAALSDILQMGADVKVRDHLGRTALVVAAMNGHWATLEILVAANSDLDVKSTRGETALHLASKNNHIGAVRSLIAAGASINEGDGHMDTALHIAVAMGHRDVMKHLLEAGADINLRNNLDEAPLHLSISEGRLDEMGILLAACPDLEWKNYLRETALQKAVKMQYHDAISLLKAAGADDRVENAVHTIQSHQVAKESVTSRMKLIQSYKAAEEQISPKMHVAERSHITWPERYELLEEEEPMLNFPR